LKIFYCHNKQLSNQLYVSLFCINQKQKNIVYTYNFWNTISFSIAVWRRWRRTYIFSKNTLERQLSLGKFLSGGRQIDTRCIIRTQTWHWFATIRCTVDPHCRVVVFGRYSILESQQVLLLFRRFSFGTLDPLSNLDPVFTVYIQYSYSNPQDYVCIRIKYSIQYTSALVNCRRSNRTTGWTVGSAEDTGFLVTVDDDDDVIDRGDKEDGDVERNERLVDGWSSSMGLL